jgi:hypothetical protein
MPGQKALLRLLGHSMCVGPLVCQVLDACMMSEDAQQTPWCWTLWLLGVFLTVCTSQCVTHSSSACAQQIKADFSNYDESAAWPYLMDEFVEHMKEQKQ